MWFSSGRTHLELVNNLRSAHAIKNDRVYQAMLQTDRGHYVKMYPYLDQPEPIGQGQTISAPHMHANALSELEPRLQPGCRALDVGSGTGYVAACMARMVDVVGHPNSKVVGIEIHPELVEQSIENVKKDCPDFLKQPNFKLKVGDGWAPPEGPYDAIHVGAAAKEVPPKLLNELAPNGILFIPVGPARGFQSILKVEKNSEGKVVKRERLYDVAYVPLVNRNSPSSSSGGDEYSNSVSSEL